ncbi:flagellar hook-length control protein FliK [Acidiphilium sp.]|uniref:flagellar hook-length control protein FliK n=1 Tax=Acidiphilium sp. TaxID=527 RepID=UPI003D001F5C
MPLTMPLAMPLPGMTVADPAATPAPLADAKGAHTPAGSDAAGAGQAILSGSGTGGRDLAAATASAAASTQGAATPSTSGQGKGLSAATDLVIAPPGEKAHASAAVGPSSVTGQASGTAAQPAATAAVAQASASSINAASGNVKQPAIAASGQGTVAPLAADLFVALPSNASDQVSMSGTATPAASTPAPATTQLTAAMVAAGAIPVTSAGASGGTRLTIAMAPPAIGMVTIQIDRNENGQSVIAVGATHPSTLDALQNDHAALQQMLTQAGVPLDQRTLSFHLEPVRSDSGSQTPAGSGIGAGDGLSGGSGSGFGREGGQQSDGQSAGQTTRGAADAYNRHGQVDEIATIPESVIASASAPMRRFGVNVMA